MTGVNQEEDTLTLSDTCGGNVTVDTVSVSPGNMEIQNVNVKKNKSLKNIHKLYCTARFILEGLISNSI